jgi:hypothetical protein
MLGAYNIGGMMTSRRGQHAVGRATLVGQVVGQAALVAACNGADRSAAADPEPTPSATVRTALTASDARELLSSVTPPADGSFSGGTFDLGEAVPGPVEVVDGRLASSSWDVYYVLDEGDVGAWGAGVKIFTTSRAAQQSADELATFWSCRGARTAVESIGPTSYDVVRATSCRKPDGHGYLATVSAVDGVVTANLTVTARSRREATAALTRVWASLSTTAQAVVADVPSGS